MAVLTVATSKRSGNGDLITGAAAAGGGDSFVNTGTELVVIRNESVGSITVTFVTPVVVDALAVADLTMVLAAGERRIIGPFPPGWYNDTLVSGGSVNMTYSGVTTLFVAVIKPTTA